MTRQLGGIDHVLCDLDGVVWLARRPIPGAADAVARLRVAGRRVVFVTNNSVSPVAEQEAALAAVGIPAADDVVTSAQAAAALVHPGEAVLVCGGDGVMEAVAARGARPVRSDVVAAAGEAVAVDVVLVGLDRHITYDSIRIAATAIRSGARFVATNDDPTFPTPDGPIPGAGAVLAAIATAAARSPEIAGKPHRPTADLVAERCGPGFDPGRAVVVGDRASTDGRFAAAVGCRFVLVRSGVTAPGATPDADVLTDLDVVDLGAVADAILAADVDR